MSHEDDDLINEILNESSVKIKGSGKEMSADPRDIVGTNNPTPVISREEADKITEWKQLQKLNAEFKLKHGIQGYSIDDIIPNGDKLVINEERVKERKDKEKAIVDKMFQEQKKLAKAVKHTLDGKTAVYGAEVPMQ